MSNFTRIRRELTAARLLEADARHFARGSQSRIDRMSEAREHMVKCLWLAGRITDEQYHAELVECLDAKTYHFEEPAPVDPERVVVSDEPLPVAGGDEQIPW